MASLRDHEAHRIPRKGRPAFVRLFAYARRYAGLIALALLLSLALGGVRLTRVYLLKPLLDDVILPQRMLTAVESPSDWLGTLTGEPERLAHEGPAALSDPERAALVRVRESFAGVAWAALAVVLALPVLQFGRVYIVEYAPGRIQTDLQRDLCSKRLALPLRFHHDRRRGDLLSSGQRQRITIARALLPDPAI